MFHNLKARFLEFDRQMVYYLRKYGHYLHQISIGVLFTWYGLLKPFGIKTTTSILAHTIWLGNKEIMVQVLGYWEILIGICIMIHPLIRVAFALLVLRLPGILIAFFIFPDITFEVFPFVPTLEGQYLLKDFTMFFAAAAIVGGNLYHEHYNY